MSRLGIRSTDWSAVTGGPRTAARAARALNGPKGQGAPRLVPVADKAGYSRAPSALFVEGATRTAQFEAMARTQRAPAAAPAVSARVFRRK